MIERQWRVSSYSGNQGDCVEVALDAPSVAVRDTKNRYGGQIAMSVDGWSALIESVKSGTAGPR